MPKVLDKRSAILNTALDLLVKNGFHNTPMSLIAKDAGVSAGIIYHYFESKEELILALYREVKGNMLGNILAGATSKEDRSEALSQVWLATFHYYASHPQETLFLEQFENSPYARLCLYEFGEQTRPLFEWIEAEKRAGNIVDLPLEVLFELSMNVAVSLAKQQAAGTYRMSEAVLDEASRVISRGLRPAKS